MQSHHFFESLGYQVMSRLAKAVTNALMAASCLLTITSCQNADSPPRKSLGSSADGIDVESLRPAVTLFCGDCHAPPLPESFPRDAWFAEVEQGYRFYVESGRSDLKPPAMRDVVAFFRAQAPESLDIPRLTTSLATSTQFRKQALPARPNAPAISFLDTAPHLGTGAMWLCDMHSGALTSVTWDGAVPTLIDVAHLQNPAHLVTCDLDSDGRDDLVVADLGSYTPGDHLNGKIWWLPGAANPETQHEPQILLDGVGRIADVQPADFDGDGDVDLVFAEFGWRKTGRIAVLLQNSTDSNAPEFTCVDVDRRHGTIHVPVCDLNQDGKPDFVALISQEHELVEAYLNLGDGQFEKQRIFTAGDPAFGSSGIEIVDLDRDGDLDVLFTNGDTLDSHYLKPSHGILWLENHGDFPFFPRQLTYLPGAMRAVPADLDGDGDLDIVATAFLPAALRRESSEEPTETLIWLEQVATGKFDRHTLEVGSAGHMTMLAADLDADGDIDLAVPNYAEQRSVRLEPAVIWWNEHSGTTVEK